MKVSLLQTIKSFLANWFYFNVIDDHYVIRIFGLKIYKKFKFEVELKEVTKSGVTKEKREIPVIVSLTTHPKRINTVYKTISLLLRQTVKPDKVVLWLAEEQFETKELPESLKKLEQYGLEVKWYEKDIKSFKKLVPSVKQYPNAIIITADDDIFYPLNFVESLYSEYLENPSCIHANRAFLIKEKNNRFYIRLRNFEYNKTYFPRYRNEIMTGYGTLFPPKSLSEKVTDEEMFMREIPTNDDIWFWGMAVLNGTKINVNKNGYKLHMAEDKTVQQYSLKKMNMNNTTVGMSGSDGVNRMCELFPEIRERLNSER